MLIMLSVTRDCSDLGTLTESILEHLDLQHLRGVCWFALHDAIVQLQVCWCALDAAPLHGALRRSRET